jgi:hypothetical protein
MENDPGGGVSQQSRDHANFETEDRDHRGRARGVLAQVEHQMESRNEEGLG